MNNPKSERPGDHVVSVLLWLAGVGVTAYFEYRRGTPLLMSAWFFVTLECLWIWWHLRRAAYNKHWVNVLVAAALPLFVFAAGVTLLVRPPADIARVYGYAGYQFFILLVLIGYAAIVRFRSPLRRAEVTGPTDAA